VRRSAARWTALALLAAALGCAGAGAPGPDAGASAGLPPGSPPQIMVMLRPAPPSLWGQIAGEIAKEYELRSVYSWTLASLGEPCIVLEVPQGPRLVPSLLRRLASDPRVESAEAIETFHALAGWNDPYARLQHGAQSIHLEQAHRWATGKGVRIAVIDTGVDFDHPDLRGRVTRAQSFVDRDGGRSFTSDIHGTAVAGVIAASANNDVGIVGVAPEAEIWALKACWPEPPDGREALCNSYTLVKALDFAIVQGAQVLNFSLGGPHDPLLARMIQEAIKRGIAVVAARSPDAAKSFPADQPGVIGIAASDDLHPAASGTSAASAASVRSPPGDPPVLAAPAVDILTTVPHGSYDLFSGSSLAAAEASGIAALLLQRDPHLTPSQLAALLRRTAHAGTPPAGAGLGAALGQVDACAALASALGEGSCP
jgi:subtilisin family serine protease